MAKDVKAFLKVKREVSAYRQINERLKDYREIANLPAVKLSREQASRCMDCGTPFCHWACPLGNYIPAWNDLVTAGRWEKALALLQATNNFPEITGRICPAPCEYSCVLDINGEPVTIRETELAIIEYGFKNKLIKPGKPESRTGKKIAIVGSGPAGLAAADQLNRAGHHVTVFEKDDDIGGILRYGIPDFKLEKEIVNRRINLLENEGIEFKTNINVGEDYPGRKLLTHFDAVLIAIGARQPRDLNIPGRELTGIHFAMNYLTQSNKRVAGKKIPESELINAKDKRVVVIGGGDTGSDCVGTANRQGAGCVVEIEVLPKPPESRSNADPWPQYPLLLKTSSSHQEGVERQWSILTKKFTGEKGRVTGLDCVKVEFINENNAGGPVMKEIPGSQFQIEADLVLLAIGFLHPQHRGLVEELCLNLDKRGNIKTDVDFMSSIKGVFSAGDCHYGQSLVVRAIREGRAAAHCMDKYLMGSSNLPVS
jgi:glutamate synthase (NADPH/NADH) small chain